MCSREYVGVSMSTGSDSLFSCRIAYKEAEVWE